MFPQILSQNSPIFDFNTCKFNIEKSKEATARVVLRREMNIVNSFTLESTYCGMDSGEKKVCICVRDLSIDIVFGRDTKYKSMISKEWASTLQNH